ncbi:ABC transporter type 1, transmembrane domain-containing protein [Ustulina deusta]|nr:ABC transporter type 1, transmembrane domain-containing protein [Ustulina deusta]
MLLIQRPIFAGDHAACPRNSPMPQCSPVTTFANILIRAIVFSSEQQNQILDRQLNGFLSQEHINKKSILNFVGAILSGVLNPLIGLMGVFNNYTGLVTFSLYYIYVAIAIFVLLYLSTVGFYYVGEQVARSLRRAYLKAILSLILSPTFALMAIFGALTSTLAVKARIKAKPASNKAVTLSQEALLSMRHVFAFGLQEHLAGKYGLYLESAGKLNMNAQNVISLFIAWTNAVPILVFALRFWVGSIFLVRGEVTAGQIATIALVVNIGAFAVLRIAPSAQALVSTVSSAAVVMGQMTRRSTQDSFDPAGEMLKDLKGNIELRGVSLVYPQRPDHLVMDNISFQCASGSGKSSVINLLLRFHEPICGEICELE